LPKILRGGNTNKFRQKKAKLNFEKKRKSDVEEKKEKKRKHCIEHRTYANRRLKAHTQNLNRRRYA
jgi:hypothetical protein